MTKVSLTLVRLSQEQSKRMSSLSISECIFPSRECLVEVSPHILRRILTVKVGITQGLYFQVCPSLPSSKLHS